MALVTCRECDNSVSDQAETCPHCGIRYPGRRSVARQVSQTPGRIALILLFLAAGIAGAAWLQQDADPSSKNATTTVATLSPEEASRRAEEKAAAEAERAKQRAAEEAQCKKDLKCLASKHLIDATVRCAPQVERLATNNFEWTDGWLDQKFSHYRWRDAKKQIVTYLGDKIKFQNGFGAWIISTYECDFDPQSNRVVDVRARAGRL